ncbi:hypothetical protein [Rhabdochlamydiaceae symbiont of Dictyostelium giganteum]|uniref:hypothetical protein n=1 Tax=Rhabdochlamydiaceae symbiont of Dictyostelium giganteum TaxID=3342349 RepID=UPI00384DD44A
MTNVVPTSPIVNQLEADTPQFHLDQLETRISQFHLCLSNFQNATICSSKPLESLINEIYHSIINYRNALYHQPSSKMYHISNPKAHLKEIFQNSPTFLPLFLRLIETLSSDEVQDRDELKRLLSKTALVAYELVAFKFAAEKRHIYLQTRDQINSLLNKILETLPKNDFETFFCIYSMIALTRKFQPGEGKSKEIFKKEGFEVIKGIMQAALSIPGAVINPKSGLDGAAYLVGPMIDLICRIYHEMEKGWYKKVWVMNWLFSGNRVTELEHLKTLNQFIENYKIVRKHERALYLVQFYFELINNSAAKEEVRMRVFSGNEIKPNFLELTQYNLQDKESWKVRYVAIKYLINFSTEEKFTKQVVSELSKLWLIENNNYVGNFIEKSLNELTKEETNRKYMSLEKNLTTKKLNTMKKEISTLKTEISKNKDGDTLEFETQLKQKIEFKERVEMDLARAHAANNGMQNQSQFNEIDPIPDIEACEEVLSRFNNEKEELEQSFKRKQDEYLKKELELDQKQERLKRFEDLLAIIPDDKNQKEEL